MGKWSADRLAATSGFVFVALSVAAFAVVPSPPSLGSPTAKTAAYYVEHHRGGLVQAVLFGLAVIAFLWFVGSVSAVLREAGEARLATVALGGGIAAAGLSLLGTTIEAALFERVALESPSLVNGLHVVAVTASTLIGLAAATLAFATAIAVWRSRALPAWYAIASAVGGVIFLFGGGALTFSGFYSPEGAYTAIGTLVFLLWVLITTVELVRHLGRSTEAPGPVAA